MMMNILEKLLNKEDYKNTINIKTYMFFYVSIKSIAVNNILSSFVSLRNIRHSSIFKLKKLPLKPLHKIRVPFSFIFISQIFDPFVNFKESGFFKDIQRIKQPYLKSGNSST